MWWCAVKKLLTHSTTDAVPPRVTLRNITWILLSFFNLFLGLVPFPYYGRPMEEGKPLYFRPVVFLSSLFFFFSCLFSAVADWMSTIYFHTWCGLSANVECRSEMCCMRLAENTPRKNSPSGHYRTALSGCIFATKACIDNRKNY